MFCPERPLRALSAILAAAAPASAFTETLLFQDVVPLQTTNWSNPVTFPKFDPALGVLTDVIVTLEATVQGSALFENLGTAPVNVTGSYSASVDVRYPDTALLARVQFAASINENLSAFDGTIDFAGTSGASAPGLGGTNFMIADQFSAAFPIFTGPSGNPGTITLPLTGTATTNVSIFPNMATTLNSQASAIVRLEYEYQPPALVETQTLVVTGPPQSVPFGGTLAVPRFDPGLGQLVAIEFRLRGIFDGSLSVENLGATTANIMSELTSTLILQRPNAGGLIADVQRLLTIPDTLAPFDGALDFAGTSGRTHLGLAQTATETTTSPPPGSDISVFSGPIGAPGVVLLPLSATGTVTVNGSANISVANTQTAAPELTILYVYQPSSKLFCFGNGGLLPGCTPCPCANDATPGSLGGCRNSAGGAAKLRSFGVASVAADTLRFSVESANPTTFAALISGNDRLPLPGLCPGGTGIAGGTLDGLRCVGTNVQRHGVRSLNAAGNTLTPWGPPGGPAGGLIAQGGFFAGQTRHFQAFYRENPALGCGTSQNTSNAVTVTFAP